MENALQQSAIAFPRPSLLSLCLCKHAKRPRHEPKDSMSPAAATHTQAVVAWLRYHSRNKRTNGVPSRNQSQPGPALRVVEPQVQRRVPGILPFVCTHPNHIGVDKCGHSLSRVPMRGGRRRIARIAFMLMPR